MTLSGKEHRVIWYKAPQPLINGALDEIVLWSSFCSQILGGGCISDCTNVSLSTCSSWFFCMCSWCTSGGASLWGDETLIHQPRTAFTLWSTFSIPTVFTFPHCPLKVTKKSSHGPFGHFSVMQSARQLCYISTESDSLLVYPAPSVRVPLTCKHLHSLDTSVQPGNKQICTLYLALLRAGGRFIPAEFSGKY